MTLGRSDRAVAAGLDYLRRVGIDWSAHPTKHEVEQEYARLWRQLGDRPIEALLDLPRMTDPVACATVDVLTSLVTPALFTDENLRCLVIGRMGNVSLEHGNSDTSCYAYTAVGNVLGLYFSDYKRGFRFAELGLDLVEQPGMDRLKARVYLAFGNLAKPSTAACSDRAIRSRGTHSRRRSGPAISPMRLSAATISSPSFSPAVIRSPRCSARPRPGSTSRAGLGSVSSSICITAQLQLIRTLRGLTPLFGCFNDDGFDEEQFERQLEEEPSLGSRRLLVLDPQAAGTCPRRRPRRCAHGGGEGRATSLDDAGDLRAGGLPFLRCAGAGRTLSTSHLLPSVAAPIGPLPTHHRQLEEWAEHCPENFASRAALVGAEIARLEDRVLDAERLYEEAIQSAHAQRARPRRGDRL